MLSTKYHSYPIPSEQDIHIDIAILIFLREEMLLGNLNHVPLKEYYEQWVFSSDMDYSWERFRRRALYQVGLGFTEPLVTYGPDGLKNDRRSFRGYLYPLRITPAGFIRIDELQSEIRKYEGINRYITRWMEWRENFLGMKWVVVATVTVFLIVCILVFDIQVSKVVQKIPLLNSVIDTKVLEEFESINEKDEFYQVAMSGEWISEVNSIESGRGKSEQGKITQKLPVNPGDDPGKIANISVRTISPTEKLFRITLNDGTMHYRQVKKDGDTYLISDN